MGVFVVPLSRALSTVILTRLCPNCQHPLQKTGQWFQSVWRYRCEGCGEVVPLTYSDKVKLFAEHAARQAGGSK